MKIIRLEAENIKRISAVSISPSGEIIEITGRNGQGKTSVLDAIWWALAGTGNVQTRPIRDGEEEARVFLDLGELKVTRHFKVSDRDPRGFTTTLTVENADGVRAQSPQALLDTLVGSLSFDPLVFTRMKPEAQFETLKQFVPGVDFGAIEQQNKSDYAKRTEINREEKRIRTQADAIRLSATIPEAVDEADLIREMEEAGEHNAAIERVLGDRRAKEETAVQKRLSASRLRDQARALVSQAETLEGEAEGITEELKATGIIPEPINTLALRDRIRDAREANAIAKAAEARADLVRQATKLKADADALTKAMSDRDAAKAKAIADAEMPVDGLTFGDGIVLFNGVPFDQASDAEQLRASILIAAAMNPKLKVIRVRDGSLLDSASMAALAATAAAEECQVWIETVQSGRPGAVVIEDGAVLAARAAAE
jgi:hypothetical protein